MQVSYLIMRSKIVILGLALTGLILAGCANMAATSATEQDRKVPPSQRDPWRDLAKGMTAEQVRATLGNPIKVRPMPLPAGTEGTAEIWIYQHTVTREVEMVPTRMEQIPSLDPMTGQTKMIPNPVYGQETRTVEEELQLLLFDGKVASWKRVLHTERSYQ